MKVQFCGAARTVTGSQHLIDVNGTRILLDCGFFQGKRSEARVRNLSLPFDAASIDVMVLSHAHIDHSGNLPNLVKQGFSGDVICTHATRDLCASMLLDSARIQEDDAEFLNKINRRKGLPLVEPIYTEAEARAALENLTTQSLNRARRIAPGVTCSLHEAGHMLGSAFVVLDIEDQETKRDVRLVFSGDLGHQGTAILRDLEPLDRADFLIMESTYGDEIHPPQADDLKAMERIIAETHRRGGAVIIPAFAVGRTQHLVYRLHQLMLAGDLPPMPVYVDSPLAIDATATYRAHPEAYDEETRAFIQAAGGRIDPFGFTRLTYTRTAEESKQINFQREPSIIIAASGMAEAGRVLHHLKNRIEDPRTTVLIVGFQAEHTLGRRIVDGAPQVKIFGETYQNNARVEVLSGFSGHADRDELIGWVGGMSQKPTRTFLVHGELPAQEALANSLRDQYDLQVDIPDRLQSFDL